MLTHHNGKQAPIPNRAHLEGSGLEVFSGHQAGQQEYYYKPVEYVHSHQTPESKQTTAYYGPASSSTGKQPSRKHTLLGLGATTIVLSSLVFLVMAGLIIAGALLGN